MMYLTTDPHHKIFSSRDPPEAKFELQTFALKIHNIQRFAHIFTTFSKIADLQACSAALGAAL
jgi:hypothetical protein